MADVDFTTMLCEPELVMITARTVLFAYINLGINNIYLTNFMVLMLCLFGYLFKIPGGPKNEESLFTIYK